jgi:alpha-D-ribose 1-methylphosphonate 5-triphosphate synthase subunit PhnI
MGYVAASGGRDAIEAAEELIRASQAAANSDPLTNDQITQRFGAAVDRVMGEGGLWEPDLAAAALRQAEGDTIEAAHLLRAHRSTMPRFGDSGVADADELEVLRRVVPAYQRPPGSQILGRTSDYSGRLLDTAEHTAHCRNGTPGGLDNETRRRDVDGSNIERRPRRLMALLRDLDLVVDRRRENDPAPFDITRMAVRPPAPRSARLAVMARAETGALVNIWYRNILGPDGYLHEITLGEVRHGRLPVRVDHPVTGRTVAIGTVRVTEVEAIEDLDGAGEDRERFDVGYGMCLGHNEKKAIAMANLDIACHRDGGRSQLEQSLLLTTDGLDATGFLEHLKLPHYVTFRSMVERKLAVRSAADPAVADNAGSVGDVDHTSTDVMASAEATA